MKQCELKIHNGTISVLSVANIMYICKKYVPKDSLTTVIKSILKIFDVRELTRNDISKALSLNVPDFEDALQILSAIKAKADYIVTRDLDHFKNSPVPPISPEEFLALI
jgi:predicted nucleic acid-binding protein